jgi:arabinofuranosyltransferase
LRNKALLLVLLLFLVHSLLFLTWIPDDAFISLRASRNLARGDGAVFNPGERVEGSSSPLWLVLLAPAYALGIPLEHAGRLLGLLCALLVILWTDRTARGILGLRSWAALAVPLYLAVSFPFCFYATSAMETPLYTLLLILACGEVLRGPPRARAWLLFGLVGLTRHEGWSFGLVTLACLLLRRRGTRSRNADGTGVGRGSWRAPVFGFFLPLGASLLARWFYYGDLLPNPFYAKVAGSLLDPQRWIVPLGQLAHFAAATGSLALVPFLALLVRRGTRDPRDLYLMTMVGTQILIVLLVGGDILAYHRFLVPVLPFLALLLGRAGAAAAGAARGWRRGWVAALLFVVGINLAYGAANVSFGVPRDRYDYWMHSGAHRDLGRRLVREYPWARTVVTNEIGAVGYYSDLITLDMNGLVDRRVARIWMHGRSEGPSPEAPAILEAVAHELLGRAPDLVVLPRYRAAPSEGGGSSRHPLWKAFSRHPLFRNHYEEAATVTLVPGLEKTIYVRKGNQWDGDASTGSPSSKPGNDRSL